MWLLSMAEQSFHHANLKLTTHVHDGEPSLVAFNVNLDNGQVHLLTDYDRRINIVVALKNRGPQLAQFSDRLKKEIAVSTFNVFLSICDFNSTDTNVTLQLANSGIPYRIIQVNHVFSKVIGLQKLIASAIDNDVIFIAIDLADIDFFVDANLLGLILKYTRRGISAYMPIPWYVAASDVLANASDVFDNASDVLGNASDVVKPELCAGVGLPRDCQLPAYLMEQNSSTVMEMPTEMGWAESGYGAFAMVKSD